MSSLALCQEPLNHCQKKRERTRQGLVEAALRLIARNELSDICLHEVAAEASVSTGTIYNYFRTRHELVEAVGLALASDYSQVVAELCRDITSGAHRLALGVRLFILRAQVDPQWANALLRVASMNTAVRSSLILNVLADLRGGLREGTFDFVHESLALEVVIGSTSAAMRAAIERPALIEHDSHMAERVLRALGMPAAKAVEMAFAPLPECEATHRLFHTNR